MSGTTDKHILKNVRQAQKDLFSSVLVSCFMAWDIRLSSFPSRLSWEECRVFRRCCSMPSASPAISIWVLNVTMLLIAFRALTRQFTVRTIIGVTIMSVIIGVLQPFFLPTP